MALPSEGPWAVLRPGGEAACAKFTDMKSAYELALEQMEKQGIEPPRDDVLSDAARRQMAEVRRRAEAKLAELEIMHQGRLEKAASPQERDQELDDFKRQRRRIEDDRDHKLEELRGQRS